MTAAPRPERRPVVFVDRDGTLHRELPEPVADPDALELVDGAADALRRLNEAGYWVVVITNQSAIARGWIAPEQLARVHAAMLDRLRRGGARVDLVVSCPHHPTEGRPPYRRRCKCRKPLPGMLREAERRLPIERAGSWMIGDAERDLAAGRALGLPGILVATGKGTAERERLAAAGAPPEHFVADLPRAVERILSGSRAPARDGR